MLTHIVSVINGENLIYRDDATHKHIIKYTVVYEQQ